MEQYFDQDRGADMLTKVTLWSIGSEVDAVAVTVCAALYGLVSRCLSGKWMET